MNHLFRIALFAIGLIALSCFAQAEEASPAFTLPAGDPLTTLVIPEGFTAQDISVAVSQALLAEKWKNLNWYRNITIATTEESRVDIKVFAVAGAADVKLYATMSSDRDLGDERLRKVTVRELHSLEKMIAKKLKLVFREARGDEKVDSAVRH